MDDRYQNVACDRQLVRRLRMLDPFIRIAPLVKRVLEDEVARLERDRAEEQAAA